MPFALIDQRKIHYEFLNRELFNCASGLLVFLHEGLGSIKQWKEFPELLSQNLKMPALLYEREGYANSSPLTRQRTTGYMHQYAFDELPFLLKELNIKKKLILIGHSDGGSIALLYASQFPGSCKAVITLAAHVFVEEISLEGIRKANELFNSGLLKERLEKYHGNNTNSMFRAWADTWLSPGFRKWNIEDRLSGINCPVLAIQGKEDAYGTDKQVQSIEKQVSGISKKVLLANCGHAPHLEKTTDCIFLIHDFLKQQAQ